MKIDKLKTYQEVITYLNGPKGRRKHLFQGGVHFLSERYGIKFFLHGAMEPFTYPIGLRMTNLCFTVLNTFDL